MRVITGTARGRKLKPVEGMNTRPTSDWTKESLFNAIQFDIEGRRVLDLFSGTGQLGIEALSRGARDAVFVDVSPAAVKITRENVRSAGFDDVSEIVQADALSALTRYPKDRFGLIFLDPPYEAELLSTVLNTIMTRKLLCEGGLIVCETLRKMTFPVCPENFRVIREYVYGKTKITLITRNA
ncbi:MAG: 16S rRNA (guanine(966)-N(2))-methyltransferase RsmD [Clostridiales bacterium]|nr:16S rRNA (guanine(966)-N(2))-methyltransferase RsmD [Clostridiales bacterium]